MASEPTFAATGDLHPNALPIEKRIELRQRIHVAREYDENVWVTPDDLEVLLRCYESGRFQT